MKEGGSGLTQLFQLTLPFLAPPRPTPRTTPPSLALPAHSLLGGDELLDERRLGLDLSEPLLPCVALDLAEALGRLAQRAQRLLVVLVLVNLHLVAKRGGTRDIWWAVSELPPDWT